MSVNRPRQPRCERLAKALEPGRCEREQARAVVRAVERDDARLAGRKQRRAQRDLDRVLTGDAELGGPRQRVAEPLGRSEEHTSELQSRGHLVCRLLLEKKKSKS